MTPYVLAMLFTGMVYWTFANMLRATLAQCVLAAVVAWSSFRLQLARGLGFA